MKTLKIKITMLVSVAVMVTTGAMAQNNTPQAVNNAFNARYMNAQMVNWKMKKDTCVAMFGMNNKKYQAYYMPDGSWIKTQRNVKHKTTLPMQARMVLKNKYGSWHIDGMQKVETPTRNMYTVEVDNHSGMPNDTENGSDVDKTLTFSQNGRLIKVN